MRYFLLRVAVNLLIWGAGAFIVSKHLDGSAPPDACQPDLEEWALLEDVKCNLKDASELWGQLDSNAVLGQLAPIVLLFALAALMASCVRVLRKNFRVSWKILDVPQWLSKAISDELSGMSMSLSSIALIVSGLAAWNLFKAQQTMFPAVIYIAAGAIVSGILYTYSYRASQDNAATIR